MLEFVILCLFVALLAYILLGGADFGSGILELFTPRRHRTYFKNLVYKAIGPIWEANHIWLIIVLVVLFVGFPEIHQLIVVHLHIPLTGLLIGIILRGIAFVFRHYDAVKDGSQMIYNRLFRYGSLISAFFLGVCAGAILEGDFTAEPTDFYAAFIAPWWNGFSLAVGVFTVAICAFLAAAYLIGERPEENQIKRFRRNALIANGILIASGAIALYFGGGEFYRDFIWGLGGIGMILTTLGVGVFWWMLENSYYGYARIVAAAQVSIILLSLLGTRGSGVLAGLDLFESAAPAATIWWLGWALAGGLVLIGPALLFLFRTFKSGE